MQNDYLMFRVNDTKSYGIYNGICELDVERIYREILKQYEDELRRKILLYGIQPDTITRRLQDDEELYKIAMETYTPFVTAEEAEGRYAEWYVEWLREAVPRKQAPGYGLVPLEIVKSKIEKMVAESAKEQAEKLAKEKQQKEEVFRKAKETGKPVELSSYMAPCNDPDEECNLDIITVYAMPDGTTKRKRTHTY